MLPFLSQSPTDTVARKATITLFPFMSLQKSLALEGVPEHDITVAGDFNSPSLIHFQFRQ
jgi:hypothetical protein